MVTRGSLGSITEDISNLNEKLDNLTNKVESLTTVVHQISNILLTTLKTDLSKNFQSNLEELNNNIKQELKTFSKEFDSKLKHPSLDWDKRLKERKFGYYEAYRCNSLALIYEEGIAGLVPRVPRKFFKNIIPQLSEPEAELRKELSIKETEHEIKRLRLIGKIKSDYVERLDNEMYGILASSCSTTEQVELQIGKWKTLVQKEEEISNKIWEEKSKFFSSDKHLLSIDTCIKPTRQMNQQQRAYADVVRNQRNNFVRNNRMNNRFIYGKPRNQGRFFNNFQQRNQRNFNRNYYQSRYEPRNNFTRNYQNNRNNLDPLTERDNIHDEKLAQNDPFLE